MRKISHLTWAVYLTLLVGIPFFAIVLLLLVAGLDNQTLTAY